MTPTDPPGPLPDILAAYADGELDAATRASVERWLAAHPDGWAAVRAQRELSPANRALWDRADPPTPTPAAWERVRAGIDAGVTVPAEPAAPPRDRRRPLAWGLATFAVALALFMASLAAFGPWFLPPGEQHVVERPRPAPEDPLAGFAVLPMATDADVDVRRVEGVAVGGWLPVGGMPLAGPIRLAAADDLDLEEADEPRVAREPGDPPVLWPARDR